MVILRESDYTERLCSETEPLRRSLRLLNKPRPDYRFPGRLGETELPWVPTESRNETEALQVNSLARPDFGHQPVSYFPKTTVIQQKQQLELASESAERSHTCIAANESIVTSVGLPCCRGWDMRPGCCPTLPLHSPRQEQLPFLVRLIILIHLLRPRSPLSFGPGGRWIF